MKRIVLICGLFVLALAGCSAPPAATPTAAPNDQQAAKVTATTANNQKAAPKPSETSKATEAYPVPTAVVATVNYPAPEQGSNPAAYPAAEQIPTALPGTSRYGVAKVDAVLDVLMGKKVDAIAALIAYELVPCTTKEGLGGPPKCEAGATEGTQVEVLPSLGAEASFMPKRDYTLTDLVGQVQLIGVFRVKADAKPEQYFPAGKYGIVLYQPSTKLWVSLRISDDGIARADMLQHMPDSSNQPDFDNYRQPK